MNRKKVSLFFLCLAFLCLSGCNAWGAEKLNLNILYHDYLKPDNNTSLRRETIFFKI